MDRKAEEELTVELSGPATKGAAPGRDHLPIRARLRVV